MTTLKIQGSDKKIKQLARELKVRANRTGLKMSLSETKEAPVKPEAKEVIVLKAKPKAKPKAKKAQSRKK